VERAEVEAGAAAGKRKRNAERAEEEFPGCRSNHQGVRYGDPGADIQRILVALDERSLCGPGGRLDG
jgi:hypothetical protein